MDLANTFDVDALRLPAGAVPTGPPRPPTKPPRHRRGESFLCGPIPWDWVARAGRQPGKALFVALLLWKEAGCEKRRTVRLNLSQAVAMGMSLDTARRGLRALETAGLVTITRKPGRGLVVTLQEVTPKRGD
jgi:hypothetical protein